MAARSRSKFAVGQRWSFSCTVDEFEPYFYVRRFNDQRGLKFPWQVGIPFRPGKSPLKRDCVFWLTCDAPFLKSIAVKLIEEGLDIEAVERHWSLPESGVIPEKPINAVLEQRIARSRELAEEARRSRFGKQLFRAIDDEKVDTVRVLLERHPELINQPKDAYSFHPPLHYAVWQGQREIAKVLINHGADMNRPGDDGMRPLHYAVLHSQPELAALLIKEGADLALTDRGGMTPLQKAEIIHETEIARLPKSPGSRPKTARRPAAKKRTPKKHAPPRGS